MNESVIIIGAGGHGKVIADMICQSGDRVEGFLDDNPKLGKSFIGFPVLGRISEYRRYPEAKYVVAIGSAVIRERIVSELKNVNWYTAVHPRAVISNLETEIGEGTVIMANAVINPGTKIGKHCIINSGAIIEHDNKIEDFVHVSVGAKLAGTVHIGKGSWIGIGAVVRNNLSVCAGCTVGAGGVVVKNLELPGVYLGVPAKMHEKE